MTTQETIKTLERYREWMNSTRQENPIELGFTSSGIDEMLTSAIDALSGSVAGEMSLDEYQKRAMTTCMDTCNNYEYMLLNLVGEVGELCGKIAKHIRKGEAELNDGGMVLIIGQEQKELLEKELGDVLWQLSGVATVMDTKLSDIARQNLEKLASRQQRNVIDGNGDVR